MAEVQDKMDPESPGKLIDAKIAALGGWRGTRLAACAN